MLLLSHSKRLLSLALVGCFPVYFAVASELENPGFESGVLSPWKVNDEGSASLDGSVLKEGKGSLRLEAGSQGGTTVVSQTLPVLQAGKFAVTVFARTSGTRKTWHEVVFHDAEAKVVGRFQSEELSGTTFEEDWIPLEVSMTPPPGAVSAEVRLSSKGGKAWFDSVTITEASGKAANRKEREVVFHPVRYRETTVLSAALRERVREENGLLIYQRNFNEHLFSNSVPKEREIKNVVSVKLTPGEREPLLIGLHATEAREVREVRLGSLISGEGNEIPGSVVEFRKLREIPKRILYSPRWTTDYLSMPMLLERLRLPFALENGASCGIMLDFILPDETPSGIYRGKLEVVSVGGSINSQMIEVEVYPFTLEEPKGMLFGLYEASAFRWVKDIPKAMKEMRDAGMTTLAHGMGISTIRGPEAKIEFDPTFVVAMENYRRVGFTEPVIYERDPAALYADPLRASGKERSYGGSPGTPEFAAAFEKASRALHSALQARGWDDCYIKTADEVAWRPQAEKDNALVVLDLANRLNLFRIEVNGPPDDFFLRELGPRGDLWVCNGEIPDQEEIDAARKQGKKVVIYNTDVEAWRPVVTRYTAGFFQRKFHLDGALQWEYQNLRWKGDRGELAYNEIQIDETNGGLAYMAYVYPEHRDNPGGPTIALIGFREGIDDYRYLLTLDSWIQKTAQHNPGLAEKIALDRDRLFASLKPVRRLRNAGKWTEEGNDEGGKYVLGSYQLDNGWSLEEYDQNREKVARWIIEMKNSFSSR